MKYSRIYGEVLWILGRTNIKNITIGYAKHEPNIPELLQNDRDSWCKKTVWYSEYNTILKVYNEIISKGEFEGIEKPVPPNLNPELEAGTLVGLYLYILEKVWDEV